MTLLSEWLRKEASKLAFKVFMNKLLPRWKQDVMGTVPEGWEKLPPMPKKGSTLLNDCAI